MPDYESFTDTPALLAALEPSEPVYCIYPHVYAKSTREFLDGFPGRVLYAIKANNDAEVLRILHDAGVRHYDCASLVEIETVVRQCPEASCYFMNPVRLAGAARDAYRRYGVRHFMVDDPSGIAPLVAEIEPAASVIFARMAVSHPSAVENLSSKFGASPETIPAILEAIADSGAEAALAFNVGSGVRSPAAYRHALEVARQVLERVTFRIRLVDIGGGFPRPYPDFSVPPLAEFFSAIADAAKLLPLADGAMLLAEPGRALAAPGLSAISQVLLRKPGRLYLNDGMYGAFWELRFKGHQRYPVRAYRGHALLTGPSQPFRIFGPTCDSTDVLPAPVELPEAIDVGDWLEFGSIGAYSLSGRTDFNGFQKYRVVRITDPSALPPK